MNRQEYNQLRDISDTSRRPLATAIYFLQDASLLLCMVFLWTNCSDSWLRFISIPLLSILMFRNFSMMHEASHHLASASTLVNDLIGVVTGCFCLLPFQPWKESHLLHHYWAGNVDKDPVMALIHVFPKMPPRLKKTLDISWRLWIPVLAGLQYLVFWALSLKIFSKKIGFNKVFVSLAAPILLWGTFALFCPSYFLWQCLVPAAFLYFLAVEVVNLPHHLELPQLHGETKTAIWDQYLISRSCLYPLWLSRFVVLNFNYHSEHHMFPDAPWYRLDGLHKNLEAALTTQLNSDPQFKWILENRGRTLTQVLAPTSDSKVKLETSA